VRTGHLSDREFPKLAMAAGRLADASIFIDDTPALSVLELRAKARRLKRDTGAKLGLIIVDYIQLMRSTEGKDNREQEISEISRSLKALAKELQVPVVALSQLNRQVESRNPPIPRLADLRECVSGDTRVLLADGRRVPIAQLVGTTPHVLALSKDGRIVAATSDRVWRVGRRPLLRVTLASGRAIVATARHRLLNGDGWTRVGELAVGDRIAAARSLPEPADAGPRERQAERLGALLAQTRANTNVDTLPRERFGCVKEVMRARGISQRAMASLRGTTYGGASHFRFAPSSATLAEYAHILETPALLRDAENDVFWDRIVAIESAGEAEVFDLTVPGPDSWLADGIVSHNSGAIEQDADVICFLYREEYYVEDSDKKGMAEVIVAKQRNGPIGNVELTFLKEYTRFENREMGPEESVGGEGALH
jgi:replicative DNA helicase